MSSPKVSIIVTVFNVEEYLDDCLRSISDQTEKNIEIIVINDGSSDCSLDVIKKYALLDRRIRVFDFDNHGVSFCRNYGIQEAKSEWIMFVDADDWLPLNAIEILCSCIEENADVICGGYNETKEEYKNFAVADVGKVSKVTDKDILKCCCIVNPKTHKRIYKNVINSALPSLTFVWGKIYKREKILEKNIIFDEELKRGEDQKFNLEFVQIHNNVVVLDSIVYNYRIRPYSASRKWSDSRKEYIQYAEHICKLVNDSNLLLSMWQLKKYEVIMKALSFASMENVTSESFIIEETKQLLNDNQYKEVINNKIQFLSCRQKLIQHLLRRGMIKTTITVFRIWNIFLRSKK